MILTKYSFFVKVNYLNACDLNYKYIINSFNALPRLNKITLEFLSKNKSSVDFIWTDFLILKFYLCSYFIFLKQPYINCNKFKTLNKNLISNYYYSFLFSYKNKQQFLFLLWLFFKDNNSINKSILMPNFEKNKIKLSTLNTNLQNVRFCFKLMNFVEYRNIVYNIFDTNDRQNIHIYANFVFKNIRQLFKTNKEVKNFLFMWNL